MKSKIIVPKESELPLRFRLGLAWCRLNTYEWDDILGPKPPGFDDLPSVSTKSFFKKKQPSKQDYTRKPMAAIVSVIGKATVSHCWWLFVLKKTSAEWFRWYFHDREI